METLTPESTAGPGGMAHRLEAIVGVIAAMDPMSVRNCGRRLGTPSRRTRLLGRSPRVMAVILSCVVFGACDPVGEAPLDVAAALRDPDVPLWTLSGAPEMMVAGGVAGGDSIFLYDIRGAAFIGRGNIVVAVAGGANRLIYLDSAGQIFATAGGRGHGPDEFASMSAPLNAGEGIAIWDRRNDRVTLLSADGRIDRQVPLQAAGLVRVIGVLENEYIVTRRRDVAGGDHSRYDLWDAEGEPAGELMGPREPPDPRIEVEYAEATFPTWTSLPACLPELLQATVGGRIFVADAANGTIVSLDQSGARRVVFRTERRAVVSQQMLQAVREQIEGVGRIFQRGMSAPGGRVARTDRSRVAPDAMEEILARIGAPGDPLPSVWDAMLADRAGRLWLRRATCYAGGSRTLWQVVDTAGALVANVAVPDGIRLWAADSGRVLAQQRDTLNVEYIAVYSIQR